MNDTHTHNINTNYLLKKKKNIYIYIDYKQLFRRFAIANEQ